MPNQRPWGNHVPRSVSRNIVFHVPESISANMISMFPEPSPGTRFLMSSEAPPGTSGHAHRRKCTPAKPVVHSCPLAAGDLRKVTTYRIGNLVVHSCTLAAQGALIWSGF